MSTVGLLRFTDNYETSAMRNLILVFGDQLSHRLSALDDVDKSKDCVWMAEVDEEITRVWSHKSRIVFFLSAMRHFRDELKGKGFKVDYHELTADKRKDKFKSFAEGLKRKLSKGKPSKVIVTEPGDWSVCEAVESACEEAGVELEVREDRHFYCRLEDFRSWASERKSLILEHFYRWMRKEHRILIDKQGKPIGGEWNFDKENRGSFGKKGPGKIPATKSFEPDSLTCEVQQIVRKRYADHPGSLEHFDYPVTAGQAQESLSDFIAHRLRDFGKYQDAMWSDTEFLFHSRISAVMNAHLLEPFEVVNAAIDAFERDEAPIEAVEGFVRQVVGWREFVRGVYWTYMPEYVERNELECQDVGVPSSYWDGETDMNCVREAMKPVLKFGYAHHIQRLMVLGLFAQLLGVHPRRFHDWHMAMYIDAIDWVSLPNTLGMSQFGDGGVVGTKPYCASGNYVDRMSDYCKSCRFDPKLAVGDRACPVTTMYWDFLDRHQARWSENGRMVFQIKNLANKDVEELTAIKERAEWVRTRELQ